VTSQTAFEHGDPRRVFNSSSSGKRRAVFRRRRDYLYPGRRGRRSPTSLETTSAPGGAKSSRPSKRRPRRSETELRFDQPARGRDRLKRNPTIGPPRFETAAETGLCSRKLAPTAARIPPPATYTTPPVAPKTRHREGRLPAVPSRIAEHLERQMGRSGLRSSARPAKVMSLGSSTLRRGAPTPGQKPPG